jgi:DNA repair protein RadC
MKVESTTAHGHRQRMRSRFARSGLNGMQDYEVLELLLTYAIPRRDVKPLAKFLIEKFHDLPGVFRASGQELLDTPGLGTNSVTLILFIKELMPKILEYEVRQKKIINDRSDIVDFLRMKIGNERKETLMIFYLDAGRGLIEFDMHRGTVDHAAVYVREITERALLCHAAGVILAHNHPSGGIAPSTEDLQLTRNLRNALAQLGIELLDHFIVTRSGIDTTAYDIKDTASDPSLPLGGSFAADSGKLKP